MYVPDHYHKGYKSLFFEHLYPCRQRFLDDDKGHEFKIRVSVRFKPGNQDLETRNKLFVPLHQRLRFIKKGEKLSSNFDKLGLPMHALKEIMDEGKEITPEIMQALMEAEHLGHSLESTVNNPERRERNREHRNNNNNDVNNVINNNDNFIITNDPISTMKAINQN